MTEQQTSKTVRLLAHLKPAEYHLQIVIPGGQIGPHTTDYWLHERIQLCNSSNTASVDEVTLHAGKTINIVSVVTGASIVSRDDEAQTVTFKLDEPVGPGGRAEIQLAAKCALQSDMKGLYRGSFTAPPAEDNSATANPQSNNSSSQPTTAAKPTENGASAAPAAPPAMVTRYVLATHMEPVAARHAYVCLDEPAARADFHLQLLIADCPEHSDFHAYSGGRTRSREQAVALPDWCHQLGSESSSSSFIQWSFDVVPKVPPYLTAIFVGPTVEIEGEYTTKTGDRTVPLKVIAGKGRPVEKLAFTMSVMRYSLGFFERLFGEPYPLDKLDFALVPDFPIGGQENWGLILAYEGCLILESKCETATLQRVASLVAHEVSHNWFGNLVGIDWWEGLWLKEGFATFCGNLAAATQFPHIPHSDEESLDALHSDGYRATHPVEIPITHPSLITQIFDDISYNKGEALVLMCADQLGIDPSRTSGGFHDAVAAYVKQYAFNNTTTNQLWEALERASGKPIVGTMAGFVTQPGHPVVHVLVTGGADGDHSIKQPRTVSVNQSRYWHHGERRDVGDEEENDRQWAVPLTFVAASDPARVLHRDTLLGGTAVMSFAEPPLLNARHTGFFRTHYVAGWHFEAALAALPKLSPAERMAFVDDVFALYDAGSVDVLRIRQTALALYHAKEQSHIVLNRYAELALNVVRPLFFHAMRDHFEGSNFAAASDFFTSDEAVKVARRVAWLLAAPLLRRATELQPEGPTPPADASAVPAADSAAAAAASADAPPPPPPESTTVKEQRPLVWYEALRLIEIAEFWPTLYFADPNASLVDDHAFGDAAAPVAGIEPDELKPMAALWLDELKRLIRSAAAETPENAKKKTWCHQAISLRYGPEHRSRDMVAKLEAAPDTADFRVTFRNLCRWTRSRGLLDELLERNFTATKGCRSQNGHITVFGARENLILWPRGLGENLQRHWKSIFDLWGNGQFRIQKIVERACTTMLFDGADEELDAFFEKNPCPNAALAARRASEDVRFRLKLATARMSDWKGLLATE